MVKLGKLHLGVGLGVVLAVIAFSFLYLSPNSAQTTKQENKIQTNQPIIVPTSEAQKPTTPALEASAATTPTPIPTTAKIPTATSTPTKVQPTKAPVSSPDFQLLSGSLSGRLITENVALSSQITFDSNYDNGNRINVSFSSASLTCPGIVVLPFKTPQSFDFTCDVPMGTKGVQVITMTATDGKTTSSAIFTLTLE